MGDWGRVAGKLTCVLAGAALWSAPVSAQSLDELGTAYDRMIELTERRNLPQAMEVARQVSSICARPEADARGCYSTLAVAVELATIVADREAAAQWARQSLDHALAFAGPGSLPVALAQEDYARRLGAIYRFSEASDYAAEAVATYAALKGSEAVETDRARETLAGVLLDQGRYDEAEGHARLWLDHVRRRAGPQAHETGRAYNTLGQVLYLQERHGEAAELFRQAIDSFAGPDAVQSIAYHSARINLGRSLIALGDPQSATPLIRDAIDSGQLEIDRDATIAAASALVRALLAEGQAAEAHALARDTQRRAIARNGDANADVGTYTVLLARAASALGRREEANREFARGVAILLATLGPQHPDTIAALHAQARHLSVDPEQAGAAAEAFRQAMDGALANAQRGAITPALAQALRANQPLFADYLAFLQASGGPEAAAEAFAVMQWSMATEASLAVTRVALRQAGADDAVGRLEAEQARLAQDFAAARAAHAALVIDPASDPADTAALVARLGWLEGELARSAQAIAAADPTYFELSRARVATLAEVQPLLRDDEAVLLVLPLAQSAQVMLVRRGTVAWHVASGLTDATVTDTVRALRRSAQEDVLYGEESFDLAAAQALATAIFAPLAADLAGVERLHVMTDGPLASLPFAMLALPGEDGTGSTWLADRFALQVLPSLPALVLARGAAGEPAGDTAAGMALVGIGAPLLAGEDAGERGGAALAYAAAFTSGAVPPTGPLPVPLADPDRLRQLAPLPGAEAELHGVSALFPAGMAVLRLGAEAVEPAVRGTEDVAQAQLLVFATHGLLARESLVGEPGLVLTPPSMAERSPANDGFLGASEVAGLSLAARLVVLSACNTGTADGRGAAGGLSGLTRAFMAAGSERVIASHWNVSDAATAALMSEFVRLLVAEPGQPEARLLARAMAHVRAQPQWRSPGYWAAFAVYGNGAS